MKGFDLRKPASVPEAPGPEALVLGLFLILSATTIILASGGPEDGEYQLRWVLLASDLVLGLVVITQVPHLRELWSRRSRHRGAVAAAVLGATLLVSLAAHPSDRGVAAVLRWFGVAAVALAVGRLTGTARTFALGAFAGVTVLSVVVGVAQWSVGGPVGLDSLGEAQAYEIGGRYASSGLTIHPYVFAAWCAVGAAILLAAVARAGERTPAGLRIVALVPFAGVGLTMSRAGALAVALVLAALVVAALRQPSLRMLLAGAILATAFGAAGNLSGWLNRAAGSTGPASAVTSGRGQLLEQAWGLLQDEPVVGVGPGRYVPALVARPELVEVATQRPSRPVHVTPYLVLVEGGVAVLPALVLVGWAVTTQSLRAGPLGVGITLSVVPFMLLDHLFWSYPQGLMLTGVWLGTLDQLGGRGRTVAAS